jgi:hypothetical protein
MNEATLAEHEHHPAADSAMDWYRQLPIKDLMIAKEAIASTALSGNRLAEICMSTLNRLEVGEPVSDRYLLGLCWLLRDLQDNKHDNDKP